MAQQGGRIDFQIGFKTDKSGIQDLKKSLQQIQKIKPANFNGTNQDLQEVKSTAKEVEAALSKAFNPNINSINLKTFDNQLKASGKTINDIYTSFSKAGAQGQVAFSQMARSVLTTNQQLKETHSIINQMGTTFVNTVKWGIASSIMNTFTSSVQGAFTYVESLEKSLTNIRIVTGDSQEKMEQFADSANRAAQELGRSTMDYSKAALTFYQQGLGDEEVQARTEAVLKAQNITGAGSQMADYLTAVWNGYKVANEQAQVYVDKLAAVADSSASDMSQLAIAMSKVASTADTMGVNVDQLNAQLATVVATTRQAPEAVGTAFKTIYTRLNDIKTGADGAQVSLGNYSGKMAELGFNVLDATGHLRDTGQVMQEIGARWEDLTREQQVYLATTMGGQRQVNQLMALFDNWTTYSELLNTSLESEGTLAQKNSVYLESLGAKMEQLGAAGERVKASLIDSESFGNVIELLTTGTNLLGTFIQAIGGGGTALLGLGGIITQVFSGVLSKEINNAIINYQNMKSNIEQVQIEIQKTQEFAQSQGFSNGAIQQMISEKQKIQQLYAVMSEQEKQEYNNIVNSIGATKEQIIVLQEKVAKAQEFNDILKQTSIGQGSTFKQQQRAVIEGLNDIIESMKEYHTVATSNEEKDTFTGGLIEQFEILKDMIGTQVPKSFQTFFDKVNQLSKQRDIIKQAINVESLKGAAADTGFIKSLETDLANLDKEIRQIIENAIPEIGQTVQFSVDFEANTQQLEQARQKLVELQNETSRLQQQMSQALTVKGTVEGIGQLGRMTSAVMSLTNGVKGLFDNSIPPMEKFTKLIMSAGYSIPTLVTGYQKLFTWTKALSAATVNQNEVQTIKINLAKANQVAEEKRAALNTLLKAQADGQVVSEEALIMARIADKQATDAQTFAQERLNAVMNQNPIGAFIMVITALIAAIKIAIAIYDKFHMSIKQADQAIENYNTKLKQTQSNIKEFNSNMTSLEEAKEEWNELSKRAGNYNETINNLTDSEKERYFELSNLIAEYNAGAVAGYDEQGNAIIRNNQQLEKTIQLLKDKRQAQIDSFYNGEEYTQAGKARQVKFQQNEKNQGIINANYDIFKNQNIQDFLYKGQELSKALGYQQSQLNEQQKQEWEELNKIISGGIDSVFENQERLLEIYKDFENIPLFGKSLETLQNQAEILDNFNKSLRKNADEREDILNQQRQASIQLLQTSDYSQIYEKAEELGIENGTAILDGISQGVQIVTEDGKLRAQEEIANDINDIYSSIIQVLGEKTDNEHTIYDALISSFTMNKKIQENDFSSLKQQNDYIINEIQKILQNNIESFKGLNDEQKKALASVFSNIFNLQGLEIDFDKGKINNVIDTNIDTLLTRTNEIIDNKFSKAEPVTKDWLTNLLAPDIDKSQIDYITQHIDEQVEKTNDLVQAILNLQKNAQSVGNLNENIGTAELLNKQAAGEKLGDKEQQALKRGLEQLKNTYPGLIEQVKILQNEWLQGTSLYTQALSNVKGALIDAVGIGLKESAISAEDAKEKIVALITNTEDLDRVSNQYFEDQQLKSQILSDGLIKIASGYDSCKKALGDYTLALGTANQSSAEFALKRSTESAEMAAAFGLDAQRVQDLAANFSQLAQQYAVNHDASLKEYEGLNENAQAAADAAVRYIRLNDAIADMQQHYDDMTTVLNELSSAQGNLTDIITDNEDIFKSLKKDIAGIINVSEDMIDQSWDDWIQDNAGNLQAAMEGSQEAVDALRDSAAEEIIMHLNVNTQALGMSKEQVANWANSLEPGQLDVDDTAVVQKLTWLMQQAGYTADQIKERFAGMDLDVDLQPMNQSLQQAMANAEIAGSSVQNSLGMEATETSSTSTTQDAKNDVGFSESVTFTEQSRDSQVMEQAGTTAYGLPIIYTRPVTTTIAQAHKTVEEVPVQSTATKENTVQALQVKRAGKAVGGKISHKNATGGNKKSSGGKGNKGKKRGGGGKKGSTKTPKTQKPVTDKPDRYHDVNLKLKDIDNDLGKLQKKQQKLTGKDLLKNLNEQLKLLEKQVAAYKEKIQLERQQANQIRNRLKKQGATFGPDGNISNYNKVLSDALKEYNNTIAKYNKMSAEEQQKNKDMLEKAKQKYENLKKDIQRYDKIISEEIPDLEKAVQETIDKQTQINIQKFKVKVDLEMDMSEAQREFNQFVKKVKKQLRDDDVLGNAQAYLKDYSSYYKGGYDVIQALTNQIRNTRNQINNIDKQGSSSIYGKDRAAAIKDLQEYTKELMSSLEDIEDIVANVKQTIFDAIDKAQDAFDEQKKEYEYIADLIDHNQKVVELLYGEDAYQQLQKYYDLQYLNNRDHLDFLKKQKNMWYERMIAEKERMNNLTKDTNAWKEANDRFEEYKKHWMDSLDEINNQFQNSIENLIDKYTNAVDKIFLAFENNITSGKGLENISEEWQLIGKQADQYLDKVNSMYEIDKLENAYRDAIDDNDGNLKAQQSLNNLMNEQLKYLKDKDKLTQYDVDRANALLQIEIKRLALEQARQSKTKLRLRRDAQGNYTYQYTADEDATRQAQQELADAENSLYNLTKQSYKNNLDDYYNTTEEMNERIRDVYKDTTLSAEEQNQKIAMIYEYYGDIINGLTQQNEDLKKFMMEDTFNEMAKMYDTNVQNFKNMTDEEKDILMNGMVPYWKSSIQDMADTFAGAGGFGPIMQDLFKNLIDNSKEYQDQLTEIGRVADVNLQQLKNMTDLNIQSARTLLDKNVQLVDSYNKEMTKVQEVINQVNKLTETYQKAKNEAIAATQAAYDFSQQDNANTVSSLINGKKTTKNEAVLYSSLAALINSQKTKNEASLYNNAASFDTGGYTGDWGDIGKAAVLHEKEIVLNSHDTTNLLSAVKITRTLDNIISNFAMKPFSLGNVINNANSSTEGMEQNITIHADFPNVTERSEIEAAFNNLVNKASQYAFRNKR